MKTFFVSLIMICIGFSMQAQPKSPVKWSFCVKTISATEAEIVATATMEKDFHVWTLNPGGDGTLIPTSFKFKPNANYELDGKMREEGTPVKEDLTKLDMGIVFYFENQAKFIQKIKLKKPTDISGELEFQTCNHEGCLPPATETFTMNTTKSNCDGSKASSNSVDEQKKKLIDSLSQKQSSPTTISTSGSDSLSTPTSNTNITSTEENGIIKIYGKFGEILSECGEKAEELSIWKAFIFGILGGFAALFFPCTFPMIPMTISFFLKNSKDRKEGVKNGILYGFFIFLVFFLLSLPFVFLGWGGDTLNEFSTNIWVNIAFFVIFTFFAFSLFGFYDISLPSSIANAVDSRSNVGSIMGIFFMAFTLAIVSFSCTGPILGLVLGNLKDTKYIMPAMSGFGIGLGVPFALFAMFPNLLKALPKSGSWLDILKNVFGFVELAFALKFLSNADLVPQLGLLKRELFVGLWIIIAILMALYFLGRFAFKADYKIQRTPVTTVLAALTFVFVGYLCTDFFGGELSLVSGFPPPKFYSYFYKEEKHAKGTKVESHVINGLTVYLDYDVALAKAKAENKPLMIDFTGWACVNCRKMEENVWITPDVYKELHDHYVIASLYVDERIELPFEQQYPSLALKKQVTTVGQRWTDMEIINFQQLSQPYYALIDPRDERIINRPRGNTPDIKEYAHFLTCGWETFKGRVLQ
jgi:thiol:disulfide interchange protein